LIFAIDIVIVRSCFLLSVSIFSFLKKKEKGFSLLSGLGHAFSKENPFKITSY